MKIAAFVAAAALLVLTGCHIRKSNAAPEKAPEIAGTWLQNGDSAKPCFIVQNNQQLVFRSGDEVSNGYFKSTYEVVASDWRRNAILSGNQQTLDWGDRTWKKTVFTAPDISGTWYEHGDRAKQINIIQNGTRLVMDNGVQQLHGYFYTTNAIYVTDNNNYGIYSPATKQIQWGEKKWTRKAN